MEHAPPLCWLTSFASDKMMLLSLSTQSNTPLTTRPSDSVARRTRPNNARTASMEGDSSPIFILLPPPKFWSFNTPFDTPNSKTLYSPLFLPLPLCFVLRVGVVCVDTHRERECARLRASSAVRRVREVLSLTP